MKSRNFDEIVDTEDEREQLREYLVAHPEYAEMYYRQTLPKVDILYPLHNSVKLGREEIVLELVTVAHLSPNTQDTLGFTPLMYASRKDSLNMITILIEAKANLEIENLDHERALDLAIKADKLPIISLLLSHGAIIHSPYNLFNFLQLQHQGKSDVLFSLECLCQQLKDSHKNPELLNEAENYLVKLKKLTNLCQDYVASFIDEALQKQVPKDLVKLMSQYEPLVDRYSFFKPKEVDGLVTQLETKLASRKR